MRCVARWGLAKTTIEDIAREADISRATVYRLFPGGREEIVETAGYREAQGLLDVVAVAMSAQDDLASSLRVALVWGAAGIIGHEALAHLLRHEPEAILPYLSFDRVGVLLDLAVEWLAPSLERFVDPSTAAETADWLARLLVSYTVFPLGVDLSDRRGCRPYRHHPSASGAHHGGSADSPLFHPSDHTNHYFCSRRGHRMTSINDMIGRDDVDDIEAILSVANTDVDEAIRTVADNSDAIFTWDYDKGARPALDKLYEKAKVSQWNGQTDLDWSTEVDLEQVVVANAIQNNPGGADGQMVDFDVVGTPFEKWTERQWLDFGIESNNWTLSQFMHGEQGALICTAKIVETVPWIDAKYYASTQVMDEARHVEVFAQYLDTKLGGYYPLNTHLGLLLEDIVNDSRWDMTYLGMQIMVEGLALAAFGFMHTMTTEPLLKQLLRYVMSDEARHVAFGVLSLQEYYQELTDAEIFERQQFAFEASVRMRDRFLQQEVWERMGVPVKDAIEAVMRTPTRQLFQMMLFSKIVPNCKKLGLLDRNDQWLRRRYEELGVIQFEDWADTGDEYENFAIAELELRGV